MTPKEFNEQQNKAYNAVLDTFSKLDILPEVAATTCLIVAATITHHAGRHSTNKFLRVARDTFKIVGRQLFPAERPKVVQ